MMRPASFRMMRPLATLALAVSLLLAGFSAPAQSAAKTAPTAREVKRAVEHLYGLSGGEGDDGAMVSGVAKKVVAYLKMHRLSAVEADKIGLTLAAASKDPARIRLYLFRYASGGTRGEVNNVVMQWQNVKGKLFAYHIPVECSFAEIHPLQVPNRKMYLLLGMEKGSGICMSSVALVVELKGDYLILDNKVFGDGAGLSVCNVAMEFNAGKQLLSVDADSAFGEPDVYADKPFRSSKFLFCKGRFVKQP